MATTISSVPFKDTAEKAAKLDEIIAAHKDQPGALIPILQKAQDVYGYLPIEVQTKIAEGLDISLEKVYEVVTFYAQFSLNPKGEYNFSVCLGTACYVKGAGDLFDKLKQILRRCSHCGGNPYCFPGDRGLRRYCDGTYRNEIFTCYPRPYCRFPKKQSAGPQAAIRMPNGSALRQPICPFRTAASAW